MKKSTFIATICAYLFLTNFAYAKIGITSPDFKSRKMMDIKQVFNGFGCDGKNISPEINIKRVPENAKSLAITMFDKDAPTGSGWWHWIVYNIPVNQTKIPSGDKKIAQPFSYGKNDYGNFGYGGPCPPKGDKKHRYVFTIYALSVAKLDVPKDASAALIGYHLNTNIIEKSTRTVYYQR